MLLWLLFLFLLLFDTRAKLFYDIIARYARCDMKATYSAIQCVQHVNAQ